MDFNRDVGCQPVDMNITKPGQGKHLEMLFVLHY